MSSHAKLREPAAAPGGPFVAAIVIATVLNPLNSSTISVALPTLLRDFHAVPSDLVWLISAYYFGSALAQPVFGKLGDAFGYARFLWIGLAVLLLTALLAPFSPSFPWLVGWRLVQAVGTSMVYPNAIGLARQYRSGDLGRILGWIGMAVGIALAIGPTIGGTLLALESWRAIFWLNAPLILLIAALLRFGLPKASAERRTAAAPKPIDWGGMALLGLVLLLLLVSSGSIQKPWGVYVLAAGIALTPLLWWLEGRVSAPAFDVGLLRLRGFALAGAITVLSNLVTYLLLYGLPSLLESQRGLSPVVSGALLLGFAGVLAVASPFAGRFAQGRRRRGPLVVSGALVFVGSLVLIRAVTLPLWAVLAALAVLGTGFAVSNVLLQTVVLEIAPKEDAGSASGLYTLLRYVGTMASSVVIALALASRQGGALLFGCASLAAAAATVLSVGIRDRAPR